MDENDLEMNVVLELLIVFNIIYGVVFYVDILIIFL